MVNLDLNPDWTLSSGVDRSMAYLKHTRLFEYSNKNASYPETRREFARESQLNDIISAPVMRTLVE